MTTIAGVIAADGAVVLGADTYGVLDDRRVPGSVKVWAHPVREESPGRRHVLVAAAGHGALKGLWRAHWKLDGVPGAGDSDDQADEWAVACAEALSGIAVNAEPAPLLDNGSVDAVALLGFGGRLWLLAQQSAVPVYRHCRFHAAGSGGDTALGALHVMHALGAADVQAAVSMVNGAVRAAAAWDPWTHIDKAGPRVLRLDRGGQLA